MVEVILVAGLLGMVIGRQQETRARSRSFLSRLAPVSPHIHLGIFQLEVFCSSRAFARVTELDAAHCPVDGTVTRLSDERDAV